MTSVTASYRPKYEKDDSGRHITARDFVQGDYAQRIAAGEIIVRSGVYPITSITARSGDEYQIVREDGKQVYCSPRTRLTVSQPAKPFVRPFVSAFSSPASAAPSPVQPEGYHDAPGPHRPHDPGAPNPGNAATVARLRDYMEHQRRRTQPVLRIPMGLPPHLAREQLLTFIREQEQLAS